MLYKSSYAEVTQDDINALVVLSSIFAWFVTPTRIPAAVTVGVAGAAGKQVGEKLRNRRRAVVPAAIAEMVNKDGLKRLDRAKVAWRAERDYFH